MLAKAEATLAVWIDCPTHGSHEESNARNVYGRDAFCFDCKAITAKARVITLTRGQNAGKEECDNRCLNGKRSCRCKCRGACHGLATCNPALHPVGV